MVRNNGGNKAKKFASKAFSVSEKTTRFSTDKDEVYATVNRMLGSNICEVLCVDGKIRLCIIRGKFSGKGRRDNRLCRGKWVLVGLRGWELTSKEKQKCDLLEVYSDNDKEKLMTKSLNKISTKNTGKKDIMAAAREMEKMREQDESKKPRPLNMPKI